MAEAARNPDVAWERRDVPLRWPAIVGVVVALFVVAVPLLLAWACPGAVAGRDRTAWTERPAPRQETDPRGDLLALQKDATARLEGWRWADPGHRTADVPIARAMAKLAHDGIPGWPGAPGPQAAR